MLAYAGMDEALALQQLQQERREQYIAACAANISPKSPRGMSMSSPRVLAAVSSSTGIRVSADYTEARASICATLINDAGKFVMSRYACACCRTCVRMLSYADVCVCVCHEQCVG